MDPANSFDRCLARELKELLAEHHGKTILEIGCAPGKWLAFFESELGLLPSGIEYSPVGLRVTKSNFETLGVKYGSLWEGDFFEIPVCDKFDIVLSLGFIEHFPDVGPVITRHAEWLKPGGLLIVGVPNFRGIYKPLQSVLDRSILDRHNLNIMEMPYLRSIGGQCGLLVERMRYIGSFEPYLPIPQPGIANLQQFVVKAFLRLSIHVRKMRFLDRINNRFLSSYILTVYRKPD